MDTAPPPILRGKRYNLASLFEPENLLREARRQKSIPEGQIPNICILDPDGDIVNNLVATGGAEVNPYWACYHTQLYNFEYKGIEFGIVRCVVGASFAVLIAFAHVTNQMGTIDGDFEKGVADGSRDSLELIASTAKAWLSAKV